eukprot:243746_1
MGSCTSKQKKAKHTKFWLISGYFNDDYKKEPNAHLSSEINKIIQMYLGELWREKSIQFKQRKTKQYEFVTDSIVKWKKDGWSIVRTNQIINPKIGGKWKVKYKLRSEEINCYIGYVKNDGRQWDDQPLGNYDNCITSTGFLINSNTDCYYLFDLQNRGKQLKYSNQRAARMNDEFEILYDLENNKMCITHNDENPLEIGIVPSHRNKVLTPAVSISDKGNEMEIISFKFDFNVL